MASIKQIEANRLNATKSTGPRTAQGKSTSSLNALKHGIFAEAPIIIGEDPDAFNMLRESYLDRWQPAAPEEIALVANLVKPHLVPRPLCQNRHFRHDLELLIKLQAARKKRLPHPNPFHNLNPLSQLRPKLALFPQI
jgi:hypothetical protein